MGLDDTIRDLRFKARTGSMNRRDFLKIGALLGGLAVATYSGIGCNREQEKPAPTATVQATSTSIPPTATPTPIPFTFNPDYPIYLMSTAERELLGEERKEQIRQVHRLLSEPLQRRLDAWGADFRVARSMDELMALPEYKYTQRPEGVFSGLTNNDLRAYGVIVEEMEWHREYDFLKFYAHELGHIMYGMLNEVGIKLNAEYYLRTMVGTEKICPTKEVSGVEAFVASCRDYLHKSGAIDDNGQYTGQIRLNLIPLLFNDEEQVVPMPAIQRNTSKILYPATSLAIENVVEWFGWGVSPVVGGHLGADYALIGESGYSPFYTLRDGNPEFFKFIESIFDPNATNQVMLSEQELLRIRYSQQ